MFHSGALSKKSQDVGQRFGQVYNLSDVLKE